MKMLFAGGGSLGPVTPLLAVAEALRERDPSIELLWVGTPSGPERTLVEDAGIRFCALPVARLTRYPSLEWLALPINAVRAMVGARRLMRNERPDLVASAGGFTGVPVAVAAFVDGVPSWLHQSDVPPILSGRLSAPFASWVTVAWPQTAAAFPADRTEVVGNPARASVAGMTRDAGHARFGLDPSRPTVLVTGGGGGAEWVNRCMEAVGGELAREANVIHLTGLGKKTDALDRFGPAFVARELLSGEMAAALAAADALVGRAGMGTITEIAARGIPSILIPLPGSPAQEQNAAALAATGGTVVFRQDAMTPQELLEAIRALLRDEPRRRALSEAAYATLQTDAADRIASRLIEFAQKNSRP